MEFFQDPNGDNNGKVSGLTFPRYDIEHYIRRDNYYASYEDSFEHYESQSANYKTFEEARQWCIEHEAQLKSDKIKSDKTIIIENGSLYRIELTLGKDSRGKDSGGIITSNLPDITFGAEFDNEVQIYNAAMNAVESMVLSHALAGVDVENIAYKNGLDDAIQAIQNNHGEW